MRYIAQIMAVFNWIHKRRLAWIFENAVNGMGDDGFVTTEQEWTVMTNETCIYQL